MRNQIGTLQHSPHRPTSCNDAIDIGVFLKLLSKILTLLVGRGGKLRNPLHEATMVLRKRENAAQQLDDWLSWERLITGCSEQKTGVTRRALGIHQGNDQGAVRRSGCLESGLCIAEDAERLGPSKISDRLANIGSLHEDVHDRSRTRRVFAPAKFKCPDREVLRERFTQLIGEPASRVG